MKRVCVCFLASVAILATTKAQPAGDVSILIGDWAGDSVCMVSGSGCHNEKVVWHLARVPDKPGWVAVRGDRLDSGKAVAMGTLEFRWDPESHTILCEGAPGIWRLTLDGTRLEGTLAKPDKSLFRRVFLRRVAADK